MMKASKELETAIKAVGRAGDVILETYGGKIAESRKEDGSPVTQADLKSNHIIRKNLADVPHHILSEEDSDDASRLSKDMVWIVDPLDGTADFIDKTGEFTVMVALVKDKKPILGVIGWPTQRTLFVAQKDRGAFRVVDGSWSRISVTGVSDLSKCRIVGSRHHLSDRERELIKRLHVANFTSIGSSLKAAKISSGEAEAYITTTNKMKEWDSAASYCIVTEAGGKMTDMLGRDLTYNNQNLNHQNGILVTNGRIHEEIIKEFARSDKASMS